MSNSQFWIIYDSLTKTQSNPLSTFDAQTAILKMRSEEMPRFLIWTTGWENWQRLKSYLESDQKDFISTFTVPKINLNKKTIEHNLKSELETTQTQANFKNKKEDTNSFSSIRLDEETISRIIELESNKHSSKNNNFDGDEITWSNIQKPTLDFSKFAKKKYDAREKRHELKIEILLISAKGKTFRSSSKNISLSGSLLEDTIPFDYYDSIFDIVVINNATSNKLISRVKLSASTVGDGLTQRIQFKNVSSLQKTNLQNLLEDYLLLNKKLKPAA